MIRLVAMLVALSGPVMADTPLAPPTNWTQTSLSGTMVAADVVQNTTTIGPVNGAAWSIPFYTYAFGIHVSPDGQYALLPAGAGGLLPWDQDPNMTALSLYQAPGDRIGVVPLNAIADPRDLERTVSHYVWVSSYRWLMDGWAFTTPDGQDWHLSTDQRLSRR